MLSVELKRHRMLLFSTVEIPAELVSEIVDELGGEIRHGETITYTLEAHRWPHGLPRPVPVLCQSLEDPDRYEVIDRNRLDRLQFQVVDKKFHIIRSAENWFNFLEKLKELEAIASNATGVEPSDSPIEPHGS